jgi:solute carrier family 35 protein C2
MMDLDGKMSGAARRRSASLSQHTQPSGSNRKTSSPNLPSDIPEALDDNGNPVKETDSLARSSSDWEMDDIRSNDGIEDDEETGLTQQERTKRKRRKRRNTLIDERIAQDAKSISNEEQRIANASFYRASMINGILIAMWYTFSISISVVSCC